MQAALEPSHNQNVMSIAFARKHNISIRPHDHEKIELIQPGNGGPPVESVGMATLGWSRYVYTTGKDPLISVDCQVCDVYNESYMVFGRPFVEARGPLWAKGLQD